MVESGMGGMLRADGYEANVLMLRAQNKLTNKGRPAARHALQALCEKNPREAHRCSPLGTPFLFIKTIFSSSLPPTRRIMSLSFIKILQ